MRDENNNLVGLTYNNETYYYKKNIQEDIIGIYNSMYEQIVEYEYDAWGKVLSVKDAKGQEITAKNHIAHINPFRYRSYYYDEETKLYYLNSRYYNPEWGRFISADKIIGIDNNIGYNLYAYCKNILVNQIDSDGTNALTIFGGFSAAGASIASAIVPSLTFGAAIVAGIKTAVTVGTVASVARSAKKIVQSVLKREDLKTAVESTITGAVNGFTDGFMSGG